MKSVITASMRKAGSSIIDLIVTHILNAKGFQIDRIARSVPDSNLPEHEIFIGYQDKMKPENVYYGVARGTYVSKCNVM